MAIGMSMEDAQMDWSWANLGNLFNFQMIASSINPSKDKAISCQITDES